MMRGMATSGDFDGQQFAEQEVAAKVVEQYDVAHARVFYRYVMGGGGLDIHYGVFRSADDGVYAASKETNARLLTALEWMRPNAMNEAEAHALGVGARNEVRLLDFNLGLPREWAGRFSHVVSCEVLCHAASKPSLLAELFACLEPGGALAFTDIMGADGADEKALKDFTDRNATTRMARPAEYRAMLAAAGFADVSFVDLSGHLATYFEKMVAQIHAHRADMLGEGVPAEYLDKWLGSLTQRVNVQRAHAVFAWGIFMCRKPGPLY
ncbi:hypothetical protein KFE25_005248 [Diacronema lutheri]|uniref:Methyltransferase type 11 domain-containing protein n=1 Tax=Diacronema lutheri TaxID=2081491 RepID=A0A8J5X5G3_DIALT|nr:hypothetical protein KFE25_005248 [Diacronema lutheri]